MENANKRAAVIEYVRDVQGFVISGYHISKLAQAPPGKMKISLDLGLTTNEVTIGDGKVLLPDGQELDMALLNRIARKRENEKCYLIENSSLMYIYLFENNHTYRLYEPHIDWPPTLWISGSMMHTVSVSKPVDEAGLKVNSLGGVHGKALDTCFGLGYSAIKLLEHGAAEVATYEVSASVIEIAKANPWSRKVFGNKRIKVNNQDVYESVKLMHENSFDVIMHDPPNVKLEGKLYSLEFYKGLYRILKRGGRIYHFVGGGRIPLEHKVDYASGVAKRLSEAGFKEVKKSYRGFTAIK